MEKNKKEAGEGAADSLPVTEHRRFIRHPLYFPLTYKVVDKDAGIGSRAKRSATINVSIGGLLFSAKHAVGEGSKIVINMPVQDKVFNVRANVVHCQKNLETNMYNVGVSFSRMNDAFKVKLVEQIYLISEFRDLRRMQLGRDVSLEEASREWIKRYSERFKRLYW